MFEPSQNEVQRSVLIVDQSEDSREALRTILQMRGVRILEAHEGSAGLAIARDQHPDVIVLDIDDAVVGLDLCDEFAEQADQDRTSLVMLGTTRRLQGRSPSEFVVKPYQYGPLIRKIEELLDDAA